jgi:N-6 DNA Methylase
MAGTRKKKPAPDLAPQADPRAPLDGALLLARTQGLLAELEADLLSRARGSVPVREALRIRHEAERAARRTADPLEVWERHFVTQVAASWVLSCIFVRTLEDRGLLGHNRIAGPGAADSQQLFFELAPSLTEREYLLTVFRELARLPAARELFDARHNPVWLLGPSAELAKKLIALFRAPNADAPGLRFGQADTRFLGDLYQDLSPEVRERFALLQTPHFVETYILDRTLERAIARFGLDETTLIDPTCGSGHFLLGAFERLVDHRLRKEPGLDVREAARRALDAVYGADINPYAVAIARFRLTLAFLEKGGYTRLADAPALPLHLVVADSLLHNPQHTQAKLGELPGQSMKKWSGEEFALEDEDAARDVLHRRFAAVVGNPPYITVKDAVLRERYRELYPRSAAGQYSVAAPFTERFFLLAKSAGFVGMITANSFMKREFGKKLIEGFLPIVNLDGVVNTAGAYLRGFGTPTVLLFGTNETKQGTDVLAVLAKRGEPSTPEDPERGVVWRSIAEHGCELGFENDYISVARLPRTTLEKHPWSLGGGGAAELMELLQERAGCTLTELGVDVGTGAVTREDDLFLLGADLLKRRGILADYMRPLVVGENLRDWAIVDPVMALWPYDAVSLAPATDKDIRALLWPWRRQLSKRVAFGKTQIERGLPYTAYSMFFTDRYRTPLTIAFAFVATHNHFVLDRGGKVFNRTAPIIKLKEGATEEDHLALLAYLNSSTACFWMKQVFFPKTSGTNIGDVRGQEHRIAYEFAGTGLAALPVPPLQDGLAELARRLDALAKVRTQCSPRTVFANKFRTVHELESALRDAEEEDAGTRKQMIGFQEDLDWYVYGLFGLVDGDTAKASSPSIEASARPFAQPPAAASAVPPRAALLRTDPTIGLIETPLYKRPWFGAQGVFHRDAWTYGERAIEAALAMLAELIETAMRGSSDTVALSSLRSFASHDRSVTTVRGFIAERASKTEDLVVADCAASDAVPFLAAYRHTESGLEKRTEWDRVWDLQRAEDRGEKVPAFDPPPKYDQKDYRDATFWRLRGKLDVPKERFISYPGCESDEDKEPVYGWAGWNHLQQAQALAALYQNRKTTESWGKDRLTPMLAGLLELIPWVKQWHNEPSDEFGGLRLGDYFETFLDGECHTLGVTREELRAWRPAEARRGHKAASNGRSRGLEKTPEGKGTAKRGKIAGSGAIPTEPEHDGTE